MLVLVLIILIIVTLKNHRLAFEMVLPIHQKVNRIQMSDEFKIMFGWQYSFKGF